MATGQTTITGNDTEFSISFNKEEVNKGMHGIAQTANKKSREFIKKCLKRAADDTDARISGETVKERLGAAMSPMSRGNPRRGSGGSAPELIGRSLGYGFRFALKDRIEYIAGSYDKDENLDPVTRKSTLRQPPSGIRASSMTKSDISLTQIYENTQGPFEVTGVISDPSGTGGFVTDGVTGADWKKKQERMGKVLYAMKGYGAGMKRRGKPAPKIQRRGFRGLRSIAHFQREVINQLNSKQPELQREIEQMRENEVRESGQMGLEEF
tara:strand:+ start:427 stop:1230 length:804 start_codon:yes stop_codon:yes gene_type:complete